MIKRSSLLLTFVGALILASSAGAQVQCSNIFADPATTSNINSNYLVGLGTKWRDAWSRNAIKMVLGQNAPLKPESPFHIEEFHTAREFRSWFEFQRRSEARLQAHDEATPARVSLLTDPQQALARKILAIREARHTIDIAYYIMRNDMTGLAVLSEIKAALKRGVSVRFLLDSTGSLGMTPHTELRALYEFAAREAGPSLDLQGRPTGTRATVEVVLFNPVTAMPQNILRAGLRSLYNGLASLIGFEKIDPLAYSLNRRAHDKILLVDGAFEERAIAFIGGRNLSNEYYGVPKVTGDTYVDFEVMMRGMPRTEIGDSAPMGTRMAEYYDLIYYHLGNRLLSRSLMGMVFGYDKQLNKMDAEAQKLSEVLGLDGDPESLRQSLLEDGVADHRIEVVNTFHNMFRANASRSIEVRDHRMEVKNSAALMARLEQLMVKENQEIVLVSPYLWLSQKQIRLLKRWLLHDPARKLTIVTNSIMTSDNMAAQILVDNVLGPELVLDRGVINRNGEQVRRSVGSQVEIYQYGRLDATDLGGTKGYGKLHAKGLLLRSSEISVIGTFNNDPRSLLLNSEGAAVIQGGEISKRFSSDIDRLKSESHLWGSDEYHAIRANPKLSEMKRKIAIKTKMYYELLLRFNLWWLL